MEHQISNINPRNGFCKSNSIFYSLRTPLPLPSNHFLDITTFISSIPHHGNDVAFIDAITDRRLTFSDVWKAVDSVSTALSGLGIRKGDVILLVSQNSIFFPIVCLSIMFIGAILTTANPLNTPNEISKQISLSKPALIFTTPQIIPKFTACNTLIPVVLIGDAYSNSSTLDSRVKIVGVLNTYDFSIAGLSKVLLQEQVEDRVALDDPATLLFSSGTTGESKGVVSTHRNLIALTHMGAGRLASHEKAQVYIAAIPMFHTFGLSAFLLALLGKGCPLVILPKFDMEDMLKTIQKYRVTYLPLPPVVLVSLANSADVMKRKYDFSSLRYVLSGGAPLSKEVKEEFEEKFPNVTILQGYALTESNGAGAAMENKEESRRVGSSGLLTANTEAKIVEPETGVALSVNRPGELWLRGPSTMKGYLNNEEATAATLHSDGWLKTGDLCYIDDDGFLFVVDRLKELIKYKGHQVPPAELEALLLTHPEIIDAAVIPFPNKNVGQYPMAYVVRKSGSSISDKEIMEFIAKQVSPYKRVRRVGFINSIPKNASGKILIKDLMKLATSNLIFFSCVLSPFFLLTKNTKDQ